MKCETTCASFFSDGSKNRTLFTPLPPLLIFTKESAEGFE